MKHLVILHRRRLRESSLLLDAWSREDGRRTLVAKYRKNTEYEPGRIYRADWKETDEWPEVQGFYSETTRAYSGDALACVFYLNELLIRLLPERDSNPELFDLYLMVLEALSGYTSSHSSLAELDPWLRSFEYRLLVALGLGFSWSTTQDGISIKPDGRYQFCPDSGFSRASSGWSGAWLLALDQGENASVDVWRMAKKILAEAIEYRLEQPLYSRFLVRSPIQTLGLTH